MKHLVIAAIHQCIYSVLSTFLRVVYIIFYEYK